MSVRHKKTNLSFMNFLSFRLTVRSQDKKMKHPDASKFPLVLVDSNSPGDKCPLLATANRKDNAFYSTSLSTDKPRGPTRV